MISEFIRLSRDSLQESVRSKNETPLGRIILEPSTELQQLAPGNNP